MDYLLCNPFSKWIIFQTQKLDITMLYSSTITDTADEALSTKK